MIATIKYRSGIRLKAAVGRLQRMKGCMLCGEKYRLKWYRVRRGEGVHKGFVNLNYVETKKELKLCDVFCLDCARQIQKMTLSVQGDREYCEAFYSVIKRLKHTKDIGSLKL